MTKKIVAIIEVRDTREYIEIEDRFVAVAGSGDAHACDRCGREHEVHATVRLEDGTTAVVGVSCAKEAEITPTMRRMASSAKTMARNRAALAAAESRLTVARAVRDEVDALPLPETTTGATVNGIPTLIMGDASVWTRDGHDPVERLESVTDGWRMNRLSERGVRWTEFYNLTHKIGELKKRIERAEKKAISSQVSKDGDR